MDDFTIPPGRHDLAGLARRYEVQTNEAAKSNIASRADRPFSFGGVSQKVS